MQPDKPLSPIRPNFCPMCGGRSFVRTVRGWWYCPDCAHGERFFYPLAALSPAALGAETVAASGEYVGTLLSGISRVIGDRNGV